MNSSVEIRNYNYREILSNINIKFDANSFNIIMSSGGSGKSSLLKIIGNPNNFLKNKDGELLINGELVKKENISKILKKIGYIKENIMFITDTVSDELLFPLINLGNSLRKSKKIMYSLTKKMGIDKLLTKKTDELSASEKLLVSLASTLIYEPEIIVIDNTLEVLDLKTRNRVLKLLLSLSKEKTIIFVSNNPEDIFYADKIILLHDKEIVFCGKKEELFKNEKLLLSVHSKLPFMVDLSEKLKMYKIIDKVIFTKEEMVDEIWK